MNLEAIIDLYKSDSKTKNITELIEDPTLPRLFLKGLRGSLPAFLASAIFKLSPRNHLFILESKEEAAYFQNDLKAIMDKKDVLFFSDSFKKAGQLDEINKSNVLLRAESLSRLMSSITTGELIVTYPEALFEKVVNTQVLSNSTLKLKTEEKLDVDFIVEVLVEYGFEHTDFVYEPGQFSVRGGIVDIYSFGNELPYRVELFDDEVESIRTFDPISQLSAKKIKQVVIVPNIQSHFTNKDKTSLLKLLPDETAIWIKNTESLFEILKELEQKAIEIGEQILESEEEKKHEIFNEDIIESIVKSKDLLDELGNFSVIEFGSKAYFSGHTIEYNASPQPSFNKNFELLIEDLRKQSSAKFENYIFSENPKQIIRFEQIFEDLEANVKYHAVQKGIYEGFVDRDLKISCYTDHQIFDRYYKFKIKQSFSKKNALSIKLIKELSRGDYVTHIDHGVGKFIGLQTIEVNGKKQETARIEYKDGDMLFVNIHSLHKISKFIGGEGKKPKIYKLGSRTWETLKQKAKRRIKDIAKDLINLYAKRKASKGFAFSKDSFLQTELEASFIYEDTPDQHKATLDVKADMEAEFPMDRLVCGDVGFGKTEIAIRAAAKAVADNKQVAVLVPTTILAMQHYKTFSERLKEFPTEIDFINRFKTAKQKKETLEKLSKGEVGIIIGTHAILSKNIKFKDLGLLIIDEEQKFGVAAKEKLRNFKVNVDTLTLTATPIPRTLQFSLMSARDLSLIRTAPPNRQPITTELALFKGEKIRDAIYHEIYRGGQVFFVHNRVKDIEEISSLIRKHCPDIDIGVAHGQMDNKTLEQRMLNFENRVYDILISTNIIESGLDIPNANTIIINNAHHFGLSDLHQLRGRVGRSNKKAFCYLLSPGLHGLPDDSRKRLKTIEQYADLGSGFDIAMKDLDIRGAGNILGAEQSGFISDIGFDTYQKILNEAIQELKETEFKDVFEDQLVKAKKFVKDCQVETNSEMLIPNKYVNSPNERLSLYRELNAMETEEEIQEFKIKLLDRFGPMPTEVNKLFYVVRIKWVATRLGFDRIILKGGRMRCYFVQNTDSPYYESPIFTNILSVVQSYRFKESCQMKQTGNQLVLIFSGANSIKAGRAILVEIEDVLKSIEKV